jgi:hypothetical protein
MLLLESCQRLRVLRIFDTWKRGHSQKLAPLEALAAGLIERRDELLDAEPPGAGISPNACPGK